MTNVPTERPAQLVAGDTWRWTRSIADYPAGTWALTYYLDSGAGLLSVAAAATGDQHSIDVAAATTAGYKPGRYRVFARATDGTVTLTVDSESGWLDVLPDYTASTQDHRSWAERALDALRAVYEERASSDQSSFSLNGRAISRMSKAELRAEIEALERRIARERHAEDLRKGRPGRNRLLARG